jgi:A/G-specific adenine glycosylase
MSLRSQPRNSRASDGGKIAAALLKWYDRHHRELPWRTPPGVAARPDPYRVWLSEIMLQQTTVETVKPYFRAFVTNWPDAAALASAATDDIMKAWAGLGYYSRARNLKKCADIVASQHGGRFPDTIEGLRALPGIGGYTAAAIAAIAFDRPAAVVDGNVERVIARIEAIETPLPAAKPLIHAIVEQLVPAARPGDFAQAMMDLGATICTPRKPSCMICPLNDDCAALRLGDPERFPYKAPKMERPQRVGAAFVAVRGDGAVLLRKRVESGLLGGMAEVPTTDWTARRDGAVDADAAPFAADWRFAGRIAHVFTHFALDLAVFRADVGERTAPADHWWSAPAAIHGEALPTVMKKAIETAIPGITKRKRH